MRLLNHQLFGASAAMRFFTEDDGGAGGVESSSSTLDSFEPPPDTTDMDRGRNQDRVEGEKPPDFSTLGARKAPETTAEGSEAPESGQKPAGEAPVKQAATKKPTEEAAKPAKKEPESKKPETKKPEAGQKPPEKKAESKEAPKEPEEKKIMTDAEIDALQPRADAPKQVVENFKQMRASMKTLAQQAREDRAAKDALTKEVEALKEATGKLPPEVEQKLKAADHFQLLFDAQNNPEFRKEYDEKITAATDGVFKLLEAHALKPEIIQQIKDAAAKNGGDIEAWPHWAALLNKFSDPLAKRQAEDAILGRRNAVKAKSDKLNQLAQDRTGYLKEMETRDTAQKQQWAKELEKETLTIGADFEPSMEKEIPEGATPEVKAAIERHNAGVSELAKAFQQNVLGAYNRDPKSIAHMAFAKVKADHFEKELTATKAELEKEKTRSQELEATLAKIKKAGRVAHLDTPSGADSKKGSTTEEGKVGGDGAQALRGFFANR